MGGRKSGRQAAGVACVDGQVVGRPRCFCLWLASMATSAQARHAMHLWSSQHMGTASCHAACLARFCGAALAPAPPADKLPASPILPHLPRSSCRCFPVREASILLCQHSAFLPLAIMCASPSPPAEWKPWEVPEGHTVNFMEEQQLNGEGAAGHVPGAK